MALPQLEHIGNLAHLDDIIGILRIFDGLQELVGYAEDRN